MKSKRIFIALTLFLISALFCFANLTLPKTAVAENNATILNSDEGILDENLYSALLRNYNLTIPNVNDRVLELTEDMFVGFTELNLSNYEISTLLGINLLNLSTVKSINLSNNNLVALSSESLQALGGVENLNLASNLLTEIDLSNLTNLQSVNLSFNKITEINISSLIEDVSGQAKCYLSGNLISDITNIITNSETNYYIDLQFNKITSVPENSPENISFDIYFQNTLDASNNVNTEFNVFCGVSYANYKVSVQKENVEVSTMLANSASTLAVGEYTLKFFNGETPLFESESTTPIYKNIEIAIKPNAPTMKAYINGTEITDLELAKGKIEFRFSADENAEIYYSVNGKSYVKGESVEISSPGMVRLSVISKVDNISSDEEILFFTLNKDNKIPDSMIFILTFTGIILILGALAFIGKKEIKFNNKKADKND